MNPKLADVGELSEYLAMIEQPRDIQILEQVVKISIHFCWYGPSCKRFFALQAWRKVDECMEVMQSRCGKVTFGLGDQASSRLQDVMQHIQTHENSEHHDI